MLLTLSISNSKCNIYIINNHNAKLNKLLNIILIYNNVIIIKFKLLDLVPH